LVSAVLNFRWQKREAYLEGQCEGIGVEPDVIVAGSDQCGGTESENLHLEDAMKTKLGRLIVVGAQTITRTVGTEDWMSVTIQLGNQV
jgi:hypothetical protein